VQIFDDDYNQLKAFIALYSEKYRDLTTTPSHLHPTSLLERAEKANPEQAVNGVLTEINRIIEGSFNWSAGMVAEFEAALKEKGIISLGELQKNFSKEYKAIIKRGEIKTRVEYYMAKDLVSNDESIASAEEREMLEDMMVVFEEAEVVDRLK